MGIADFSSTLRNKIITRYKTEKLTLAGNTGTRIELQKILSDSDVYRSTFATAASGHTSVLTKNGLHSLIQSLNRSISHSGGDSLAKDILSNENIYSEFKKYVKSKVSGSVTITKLETSADNEGILLKNISQANLRQYFREYLEQIIPADHYITIAYIMNNIQSGHLAGLFSTKVKQTLGVDVQFADNPTNYRDFTVTSSLKDTEGYSQALEYVIKGLIDADYLTSNVQDVETLFLKATKTALGNNPKFYTELQFGNENEVSGKALAKAGSALSKIFLQISKPNNFGNAHLEELADGLNKLVHLLNTEANKLLTSSKSPNSAELAKKILSNADSIQSFINTKGSPSIKQGIVDTIKTAIRTGKIEKEVTTTVTLKDNISSPSNTTKAFNSVIKEALEVVKSAKNKLDTKKKSVNIKSLRNVKGQFTSLTSLQTLINIALNAQITKNMGDGTRSDILNYRTGRFAASAAVERITQGRDGMLTAYYTYMKYPYQTFEPGFKQGSPASRNPKLLISKSIREIATSLVTNKLRAVLV